MEKKRQHFVPKLYLRHFSWENNKKQIGLFHTERNFFYPTANIVSQAYKPFFYGTDGEIEEELSKIEGEIDPLLTAIHQFNAIPAPNTDDRLRLLYFTLLMSLRNPVASEDVVESGHQLRKTISEMTDGKTNIDPKEMTQQEEAVQMVLHQLELMFTICADLNMKLLINETATPLITSDNPVVKYNQFLEQRRWPASITGYGCIGIQIILPLSPDKMLLIYDNDIYKVGDKRKQTISLTKGSDIDQLNCLQFLNCKNQLFFNHQCEERYLHKLLNESAKYPKANIDETLIFPLMIQTPQGVKEEQIIRQGTTDCKIKLSLDNINLTKKAKNFVLSQSAAQLRPRPTLLMNEFTANAYHGPYNLRTTPPQTK